MTILLTCPECQFERQGSSEKDLMNKIIIWNHVKKSHPSTAERIMRLYTKVPDYLYNMRTAY